ncbi:MAG: LPS export ABC transporter permease LptF [Paracoccaceae bacterium]
MGRFDRYMMSQLLVLFGFFSLVLVSVYWVNRAIGLFDQLISNGQNALVFLEFTALSLPYVILLVLPISGFVAAVYVTNRLSSESEMVVLQTAGASPFRIARPVFFFGLIVAVLVTILAHILVPAARTELAGRSAEVSRDITARFLKEGQFLNPAEKTSVYIREITSQGELEGLFLEDARTADAVVTYTAKRALLVRGDEGPRLLMFNGFAQTYSPQTERLSTVAFDEFVYNVGDLIGLDAGRIKDLRELPTAVLLNPSPADIAGAQGELPDFLYEAHDRVARSLLAIISPLIGFAALMLGGFSRFGVWRQVILAVVLIIAVQMIANSAEGVGRQDANLFWTAYLSPLSGLFFALVMLGYAMMPKWRKPREPALP